MIIGIIQYFIWTNRLHNDLLTQQVVSKYDFYAITHLAKDCVYSRYPAVSEQSYIPNLVYVYI